MIKKVWKKPSIPRISVPKPHIPRLHIHLGIPDVLKRWVAIILAIPMNIVRFILAIPMQIMRSPIGAYRQLTKWRDWIFAKIEYLNSESEKWKRAFNIAKSPYSFLRMMGFSPQMAIGLLALGSTAGAGVAVNETILAEKSFSNGDAGIYTAPINIPIFADQEYNTLRLDLGATSVGLVEIDSISLGTAYAGSALPSGQTNVVIVGGLPAVVAPAFT